MKKVLSLFLAMIMVVSTFVFTSSSLELIFSDDFNAGFLTKNWNRDSSDYEYYWDKYEKCIYGYSDTVFLNSNYGTKYERWWAEGYLGIHVHIHDFDDYMPEHEGRIHSVSLWYRDLFENYNNNDSNYGAVYIYKIEIETGKATLTKQHSWKYRDENGTEKTATTDAIIAEAQINGKFEVGEKAPYYELGWKITSGKIECYFDGGLLMTAGVDPDDPKYGDYTKYSVDETVGTQKCPFVVCNEGNYIALDNFHVWTADYAPGHDLVLTGACDPTCTGEGYTGDWVCEDCGIVAGYGSSIPPAGHTPLYHESKAPTCTQDGWYEYETCSKCDYSTFKAIPATGHQNTVIINTADPTCTENGYTGNKYCNDCNTIVEYGSAISPNGHQDTEIIDVIEVTCTTSGYSGNTYCYDCNSVIAVGGLIPASGHTEGEWVTVTEPTDTTDGLRTKSCTVCGEEIASEIIPGLSAPAFTPGDANIDGSVNLSDVTLLLQYIAKWDVTLDASSADVTGDGIVNLSDVTRLLQYIANWDVTLG